MMRTILTTLLLSTVAAPASAAVVASSLPYPGSPDWRTVVFGGTSMTLGGSSTTLTTAEGRGVWFGHTPGSTSWSLGSNAQGNKLVMTMRLDSTSRDWSAYMADGARFAGMLFNPTINCNGNVQNCTLASFTNGVNLSFAAAANGSGVADQFVALDLTQDNLFGFEMKDGLVRYRVNNSFYTGFAQAVGSQILVIGDGSGSTLTGWGSMTVSAVSFDNGPTADLSLVPEPGTWALMIGGFGLAGAAARRRSGRVVSA